jgi:glycosyltransferase involved in cell wall biosynthesis
MTEKHIRILGTRGVPAAHGGFETFAEHLALHLKRHDWRVTVYCQEDGVGPVFEDTWEGIRRVRMPVSIQGAAGTVVFDWRSTIHAAGEKGLILTLGYNTAVFCTWYRLKKLSNLINMDGIEWRRQKWGIFAKTWFWLNDGVGCWLGNHLIADHPEIKRHLATRVRESRISVIPYGSDRIDAADAAVLREYGVEAGSYAILIARPEPENSILQVVRAWSLKPRNLRLVVLGRYEPDHTYQRAVREAASEEVLFVGAIYEKRLVQALRFFARFYVHGHQVGGTNPSLVEALGAGNAVLAHDNAYNRWVAGGGGIYFRGEEDCESQLSRLLADDALLESLRKASRARHAEAFTWEKVLNEYEQLLQRYI